MERQFQVVERQTQVAERRFSPFRLNLTTGCYIRYSDEGTGLGRSPHRPLLAVPNVTAHPSTASVPITVLLYNGPLLYGFNVPIKGLIHFSIGHFIYSRRRRRHRVVVEDRSVAPV